VKQICSQISVTALGVITLSNLVLAQEQTISKSHYFFGTKFALPKNEQSSSSAKVSHRGTPPITPCGAAESRRIAARYFLAIIVNLGYARG
jgi:hypothetical protein